MRIHQVEQKTQEWQELRRGKITGTGLKRIVGSKTLRDNYLSEILAERLSVDDGVDESALDRGERLESTAIEAFESKTGKIVERIGFIDRDDNKFMALSPDGLIQSKGKYTEAVEIKCLSSANHIQAWLENVVPKDYYPQAIQYFIVNDDLETLYFVLYDPRVAVMPMCIIILNRSEIEDVIEDYKKKELDFISEVESKLEQIIKF